jgi:hypothetical protein
MANWWEQDAAVGGTAMRTETLPNGQPFDMAPGTGFDDLAQLADQPEATGDWWEQDAPVPDPDAEKYAAMYQEILNRPEPLPFEAPEDATELERLTATRGRELFTGIPSDDNSEELRAAYESETDPELKRQRLVDYQIAQRYAEERRKGLQAERDDIKSRGISIDQKILEERAKVEAGLGPDMALANAPIMRGAMTGVANATSNLAESALRILPGEGAPSQLADKLGRQRADEGQRQAYLDQQQGEVASITNAVTQMTGEYLPLAAVGVPAPVQVGARSMNDAYLKSDSDTYAITSAIVNGALTYAGGKLAGGTFIDMLAGKIAAKSLGPLLKGYGIEPIEEIGQLYGQALIDRGFGVGDGRMPTAKEAIRTLAVVVGARAVGTAMSANIEDDGIKPAEPGAYTTKGGKSTTTQTVYPNLDQTIVATGKAMKEFVSSPWPSRKKAVDAGVQEIAKTARDRKDLAADIRTRLTGQQFTEQIRTAATSPEEADALLEIYKARASSAGETFDDYVGKRIKGVEKTTSDKSVYLAQRQSGKPDALAQPAYHGSPHKFDKFTTDAMGTGEGAQAYGWGLYFAGNKAVAKYYQEKLRPGRGDSPRDIAARIMGLDDGEKDTPDRRAAAITEANARKNRSSDTEFQSRMDAVIDVLKNDSSLAGALYKVDLKPSEDEYLDWDHTFKDQSETVQSGLLSLFGGDTPNIYEDGGSVYDQLMLLVAKDRKSRGLPPGSETDRKKVASKMLSAHGIRGIRYLDGTSRGDTDNRTHNYVIFDGADAVIEEVLAQKKGPTPRGEVQFLKDEGTAIIRAFEGQNLSTLLHETGHIFRRDLAGDDLKIAERWAGARGGKWNRKAEEKFARGFENYLATGKAPTTKLAQVFEKFKNWLAGVYGAIKGTAIDVNISPEMRGVFDRLLTPAEQSTAKGQVASEQSWKSKGEYFQEASDTLGQELQRARAERESIGDDPDWASDAAELDRRIAELEDGLSQTSLLRGWSREIRQAQESGANIPKEVLEEAGLGDKTNKVVSPVPPKKPTSSQPRGKRVASLDDFAANWMAPAGTSSAQRQDNFGPTSGQNVANDGQARAKPAPNLRETTPDILSQDLADRFRGLANQTALPEARAANYEADVAMGIPERKKWADAEQRAAQRIQADPTGELSRVIQRIDQANEAGGTINLENQEETALVNRLSDMLATDLGNPESRILHRKLRFAFRAARSDQARALGYRDPLAVMDPEARKRKSITDAIAEPTPEEVAERKKARTPEQHAEVDRKMEERYTAAKEALAKQGIDLDDIDSIVADKKKAVVVLDHLRASGKFGGVAYEYWRNAILSGAGTHVANATGNIAFAAYSLTAERAAESFVNLFTRDKTASSFGEFKYLAAGVMPGIMRGLRNARTSWALETSALAEEIGREGAFKIDGPRGAIKGKMGRIVRSFGYRPLLAADEFAKSLIVTMEVGARAHRAGKGIGLSGNELTEFVRQQVDDLGSVAWSDAIAKADQITLQGPHGVVADRVAGGVDIVRKIPVVGKYIGAFRDTPAAIFEEGFKRLPVLGAIIEYGNMRHRGSNMIDAGMTPALARQLIAMGALAAIWEAVSGDDPWLTGAADLSNDNTRDAANRGRPPQSIKVFGKWRSYARIEPFATMIATTADVAKGMQEGNYHHGLTGLLQQVKNKSFLDATGDALDAGQGALEGDWSAFEKWGSKFAASWVPNIYRSTVSAAEDEMPENRVWGKGHDRFMRNVLRTAQAMKLPFVDTVPRYDVWGRTIDYNEMGSNPATSFMFQLLSPSRAKDLDNIQQADLALIRWNEKHPDDQTKYSEVPNYVKLPDEFGKRTVTTYLTDEQHAQYAQLSGELAKEFVSQLEFDPVNPTAMDIRRIKSVIAKARKAARLQLLPSWTFD